MADGDQNEKWRYSGELPEDRSSIASALRLLQTYSGIPTKEIDSHVIAVRDKAFEVFHYPCIGRWRFLDIYLTGHPEYEAIIKRLKSGETLLDLGCCFGQVLRQLVADGAPDANLTGTDLRAEFVELGYDLFLDKNKTSISFVTGDILNEASLVFLDSKFDIVHVASFFHLFGWDDQVKIGVRIVNFLRSGPRALVVERQVGTRQPSDWRSDAGGLRYLHNVESFQALWDQIGERTRTKWKAIGSLSDSKFDDLPRVLLQFAIFAQE